MKKLLLIISAGVVLFTGCGNNTKTGEVTESILWEITGGGLENPSYLLGTHHFAPVSVLDNYPSYKDALASASVVVGELDMNGMEEAQGMMMQAGMMPEGVTYRDLLSGDDYAKLDELLTGYFGAGLAQFGQMKPAMILNMYVAISYIKANPAFNPMTHIPIDTYVQNLGIETGKEIVGLESIEEQIELLLNFEPLEVQVSMLLCTLENDDDSVEDMKKLDELYKEGKLQDMYDMSFGNPDEPCGFSEQFELAINKLRNDKWLEKLPGIMAEGPAFIAVGGLHLAGDEGLINRLREKGYTVEPIK